MPKIYDSIENNLINGLTETLEVSKRADCCVGYFNLNGFTEEELDFIINYDIKYRMGKGLENGE